MIRRLASTLGVALLTVVSCVQSASPARADDWSDLLQQFLALHDAGKFNDEAPAAQQLLDLANQEQNQARVAASLGMLGIMADEALVVEPRENPVYFLDRGPPIIEGPSATLLYNLSQRETANRAAGNQPVLSVGNPKYPAQPARASNNNNTSRSGGELLASFRPGSRYATHAENEPAKNPRVSASSAVS